MPSPGRTIRNRYGVPAKVGMTVKVDGESATIVGFKDGRLQVRIYGQRGTRLVHPRSGVKYPAAAVPPPPLPGVPATSRTPLAAGERVRVRQDVVTRWSAGEDVPQIAAATGQSQGVVRQLLAEGGVHDRSRRRR